MYIRSVTEADAQAYLDLLRQLDEETKFMMYEPGERTTTVEGMKEQIRTLSAAGSVIFAAVEEGRLVGFLCAERGFARRIRHSAYLFAGVLQAYAGRGIGRELFRQLDSWAEANEIKRLELTVMTHNERAIKLYKHSGFVVEGVKKRSMMVDGSYMDEYYMGKLL